MCAAGCQILCFRVNLEGLTISLRSSVLLHFSFSVSESNVEGVVTGGDNFLGVWKQALLV
jgi:hypothetical protein